MSNGHDVGFTARVKAVSSFNAKIDLMAEELMKLHARIEALESKKKAPAKEKDHMTVKAYGQRLGLEGNQDAQAMFKVLARKYCTTHGLPIRKDENLGRAYEYFPVAALKWAEEQYAALA